MMPFECYGGKRLIKIVVVYLKFTDLSGYQQFLTKKIKIIGDISNKILEK